MDFKHLLEWIRIFLNNNETKYLLPTLLKEDHNTRGVTVMSKNDVKISLFVKIQYYMTVSSTDKACFNIFVRAGYPPVL